MNERSVAGLFAWLYYVSSRRRISLSLFSTSITPRISSQRRFNSSACCMATSRSSERDSGYLMCLGEEGKAQEVGAELASLLGLTLCDWGDVPVTRTLG